MIVPINDMNNVRKNRNTTKTIIPTGVNIKYEFRE